LSQGPHANLLNRYAVKIESGFGMAGRGKWGMGFVDWLAGNSPRCQTVESPVQTFALIALHSTTNDSPLALAMPNSKYLNVVKN